MDTGSEQKQFGRQQRRALVRLVVGGDEACDNKKRSHFKARSEKEMSTKIENALAVYCEFEDLYREALALREAVAMQWRESIWGQIRAFETVKDVVLWAKGETEMCVERHLPGSDKICPVTHMVACGQPERLELTSGARPVPGMVVQFFGDWRHIDYSPCFKKFRRNLKGRDYSWTNSVERYSGVSQKEWRQRGAFWMNVTRKSGVPRTYGFSFDILTEQKAIEILWTEVALEVGREHPADLGYVMGYAIAVNKEPIANVLDRHWPQSVMSMKQKLTFRKQSERK